MRAVGSFEAVGVDCGRHRGCSPSRKEVIKTADTLVILVQRAPATPKPDSANREAARNQRAFTGMRCNLKGVTASATSVLPAWRSPRAGAGTDGSCTGGRMHGSPWCMGGGVLCMHMRAYS